MHRRDSMLSLAEFHAPSPLKKFYCPRVTPEEYEYQMVNETERAIKDLIIHLEKNPDVYRKALSKRKQEEMENSSVFSLIKFKFLASLKGGPHNMADVTQEELEDKLDELKTGMLMAFNYAQAEVKQKRYYTRLAARRAKMAAVAEHDGVTASNPDGITAQGNNGVTAPKRQKVTPTAPPHPPVPPPGVPEAPQHPFEGPPKGQTVVRLGPARQAPIGCAPPKGAPAWKPVPPRAQTGCAPGQEVVPPKSTLPPKGPPAPPVPPPAILCVLPQKKSAPREKSAPQQKSVPKQKIVPQQKRAPQQKSVPKQKIAPQQKRAPLSERNTNIGGVAVTSPYAEAKARRPLRPEESAVSIQTVHDELLSCNALTRLKSTKQSRSPGGTPVRNKDTQLNLLRSRMMYDTSAPNTPDRLNSSEPLTTAFLRIMEQKFRNVRSPTPSDDVSVNNQSEFSP